MHYDIAQDYICSCVLRIAREMFALLPIEKVIIHAMDTVQDAAGNKYNETVATVDENGKVTAIGDGTATISASANSGVVASFDVNVDGTKTLMKLNVKYPREDDVNIGDDWSYDIQVNGERAYSEMGIAVGETLNFYAQFTESDDNPDVGSAKAAHTVTVEDISNGFEVSMDVYVSENGGKNSGKSAHFVVTFTFSPN